MDPTRRKILETGAAATAMAAAQRLFGKQTGKGAAAMSFYEKGPVRIHYEEAGSGFPLLLIPGGGLNSVIAGLANPFNAIEEFKGDYRCIASDLRNANPGQSSGPLDIDRPWDSHTDDQLAVLDHLGVDKFLVMGFCIGGPFIWNLIEAGAQSRGRRRARAARRLPPGDAHADVRRQHDRLGTGFGQAPARDHHGHDPEISHQDVPQRQRLRLHRDARFRAQLPDAGADPARRYSRRIPTPSPWSPPCSRPRPK